MDTTVWTQLRSKRFTFLKCNTLCCVYEEREVVWPAGNDDDDDGRFSSYYIRQKYNRRDDEMDGWIGYTERGSGVECACRHSATNPTGHSLSTYITKCFKSSNFASPAAANILYSVAAPVWPNRWCNLLLYWMNSLFFFFSLHDKIPYRNKTYKGATYKRNSQILALPAARQTHTQKERAMKPYTICMSRLLRHEIPHSITYARCQQPPPPIVVV